MNILRTREIIEEKENILSMVSKYKSNALLEEQEELKNKISTLKETIRNINKNKDITITESGTYEIRKLNILFPKGTSKQFKEKWLQANGIPTYSEFYNINSQYDCTGKVYETQVKNKKQKVSIVSFIDV
jgi:hypothetical protein